MILFTQLKRLFTRKPFLFGLGDNLAICYNIKAMFINQKTPSQLTPGDGQLLFDFNNPKFRLGVWIVAGLSAISMIVVGILLLQKPQNIPVVNRVVEDGTSLKSLGDSHLSSGNTVSTSSVQGENVFFVNFYVPKVETIVSKIEPLSLPVNIKSDAANYYPFTRQIDLDKIVDNINNQGFGVIDNPFGKDSKDFLQAYQELNKRNVPFLVTADFMMYSWQNRIKTIYKQAEADIFYRDFWDLNKELFTLADKRYRDRYAVIGVSNDPLLEAMRLEAVYFAMNLELLKPKAGQILRSSKESVTAISGPGLFTGVEADHYRFTAPDYLDPSVQKELDLIAKNNRNTKLIKSPALLYDRDYSDFSVPDEYRHNAHLNNFYLASRFTTSLFPLFFKNEACPSCLLDKEDWTVNLTAATLIARDLSVNQVWKNRWARVYKAMSFFNSLRNELTYLDYDRTFKALFNDKTVEEVFDKSNPAFDTDLLKYRDAVAFTDFDPAQGGLNRQLETGKQLSGMRILQEKFSPETFIYDKLTFDAAGDFINYDRTKSYVNLNTGCSIKMGVLNRCLAISLDLINPLFDEPITSQYFAINTNYNDYNNQVSVLRRHFAGFNDQDWHSNLFWTTLDINRKMLNSRKEATLTYTLGSPWTNQLLNTSVSSNLNAKLPLDTWEQSFTTSEHLSTLETLVKYHYVEPNLALVSELAVDSQMIFKTFVELGLVKENNDDFVELVNDFETIHSLVVKQLNNEEFLLTDWVFLNEFVGKNYVSKLSNKNTSVIFNEPDGKHSWKIQKSLDGFKLLVSLQKQQGRLVLVAGPVFNFSEIKK